MRVSSKLKIILKRKMFFKFILIALLVSMLDCQSNNATESVSDQKLNATQNVSVQPNQLPYPQEDSNSRIEITKLKFDINMTADKLQMRTKRFIPIIAAPFPILHRPPSYYRPRPRRPVWVSPVIAPVIA